MEQRGQIKSWNDDKGFGFIQPPQGEPVFVHISAMHGERRPQPGDAVLFVAGRDAQGRVRAEHVRLDAGLQLDSPSIRVKPARAVKAAPAPTRAAQRRQEGGRSVQSLGAKLLVFFGLCALPGFGALHMLLSGFSALPLAAYGLVSLLTFFLYWSDKRKAQGNEWRTPEKVLHAAELAGGWPGALVAQQVLRHKTRKVSYQASFWLIVVLHQAFWADRLLFDGRYLGQLLRALPGF